MGSVASLPRTRQEPARPGPAKVKARPRPRYVRACDAKAWTLVLHERGEPRTREHRRLVCYTCRSWRHPGPCQDWRSHFEFRRVEAALHRQPDFETPAGEVTTPLLFFVLTLDQGDVDAGRPTRKWSSKYVAFRALWRGAQSFRQAIGRRFKDAFAITAHRRARPSTRCRKKQPERESEPTYTSGFVSTVEAHRTGWPHLNIIISNRAMAAAVADDPAHAAAAKKGKLALQAYYRGETKGVTRELKTMAIRCGFGISFHCSPVRNRSEMAGYITKNAKQLGKRVAGELVKLSQVPEDAPPGFRRIRSSIRFLDAPHWQDEWQGGLDMRPIAEVRAGWDRAAELLPDVYGPHAEPSTIRVEAAVEAYRHGENAGDLDPGRLTEISSSESQGEPATLPTCSASTPALTPFASCVARPPDPPRSRLETGERLSRWYRDRVRFKQNQGPDLRRAGPGRWAPFAPVDDTS